MKPVISILLLFLTLVFANLAAVVETVEKWVHEDGVTHYTDKASVPEGVPSETVEVPEGTVVQDAQSTTERLKRQADKLEQERKQRAQEAEEADREEALEEALEREEIYSEPEKKKKKKRRKKKPVQPTPPPPEPPKPPPPSFQQ